MNKKGVVMLNEELTEIGQIRWANAESIRWDFILYIGTGD